ncbi:MAG TPA: hypothetical protein PKC24_14740, partial [Cyclobacteriaceae bacterium]|nr:hypothetical protein [Cyclobacteriaceae bacterium]
RDDGNGSRRLIIFKKEGLVDVLPQDLITYSTGSYGTGSDLGNGNFVVAINSGGNLNTIQGLEPDTEYGVAIFEYDGSNGRERYLVNQFLSGTVKTSSPPTIPTNGLLFNSIGTNSVNLSWTNGDGERRMVVMRPAQPVTFQPENLNSYSSPSTNFNNSGDLGDGHRFISRASGNNVNVSNLTPGTTYHVAIFEYNGINQPVYTQSALTGFFTTPPDNGLAIGGFDAITFCPGQTFDAPYLFAGVLNAGNIITIEMSDITGDFSDPIFLGQQSTINAQGFITASLPLVLGEGTGYRIRVRSSDPPEISNDNGADLQIFTSLTPDIFTEDGITSTCGEPIVLETEQPGYLLQWFKDGEPIEYATSNKHIATSSGSYQLRISGAFQGCQLQSDPINLSIVPRPDFDLTLEESYCLTEPIILLENALPADGIFSGAGISDNSFNPMLAGVGQHLIEYTYTDDISNCTYAQNQFVTVLSSPDAPESADVNLCEAESTLLSATGAEFGDTYLWYNQAEELLLSTSVGSFTVDEITESTSYLVSILSASGCESLKTTIEINLFDEALPPVASDVIICELETEVTLTASGSTDGNYRWFGVAEGGIILGENAEFITPALSNESTFFVSLISADGCESERTAVNITLETPPAPQAEGVNICQLNTQVTLTASGSTDGNYRWYDVAEGGNALG